MRPLALVIALILATLGALAAPEAVPQDHAPRSGESEVALPGPDDDAPHAHITGRFTGSGLAHGLNGTIGLRTANITQNWTLIDGTAIVATVTSDMYRIVCHDGTAHIVHANGSATRLPCSMLGGQSSANVSVIVSGPDGRPALDTHVTIDDENSTTLALATAASPPNPWPGFVVALLAVLFLVAAALLAWLYVSERRISRYLVRRLFEETQGRVPKEWPEHLRRRVIARFLVGGKN